MTKEGYNQFFKTFLLLFLSPLFFGCASYTEEHSALLNKYKAAHYDEALALLETSSLKDSSTNKLLYLLEKASLLRKLEDHKNAQKNFIEADKIIDKLFTKSILKGAASFVYNDTVTDYDGELFERISIHTLLAFSFVQQEEFQKARVEAKKINGRLKEFTDVLGDSNNSYREDAFARYLSGIIFETLGELDDALIDYNKALKLYESLSYQKFYGGNVTEQIARTLYPLALKRKRSELAKELEESYPKVKEKGRTNTGELIVLHEVGLISLKEAKDFFLGAGSQLVRFSYPVINPHWGNYGQTGVFLGEDFFIEAENTAYMSAIAQKTLEEKRLRLIAKGLARVLIKSQVNRAVHDNLGPLAGLLSNVVTAATEVADTRSWMTLPDSFYVTRKKLPAGTYTVQTVSNGRKSKKRNIKITEGRITLLKAD